MQGPDGASRLNEAEKAFRSYRRRRDAGEDIDLDRFCAEHDHLAEELRFLDSVYVAGQTAGASTGSFRDVLAAHLGGDALRRFSLADGDPAATVAVASGAEAARYLRKEEVGRGGMSRIFKVWDHDLRRTLAMKVAWAPGDATSSERDCKERLVEEALVTAQLDHTGIPPVYDVGFDRDGRAYFTMRLIKGRSFREAIDLAVRGAEGWSRARALEVLVEVCRTVAWAHARGVLHRDLKPGNIMVASGGEAYVMDWGLAKILGREDRHAARLSFPSRASLTTVETRRSGRASDDPEDPLATPAGTVVGTPVYMPPEQAQGRMDEVGRAADVYALGAVLYTLLAGRPPYVPPSGKASPLSILGKVIEGPPQPVREIAPSAPRELVSVCEKAMARAPGDRYGDALALGADLRAYLGGGRAEHTARSGSRRARTLVVVALLVLGAALLGMFAHDRLLRPARPADEVVILAELQRVSDLEREAAELWPATSGRVGALGDWLTRAAEWSARADHYRALAGESAASRENEALRGLLDGIDRFLDEDPRRGAVASVEQRLEEARTLRKRTIDDAWALWQEAIAAIADDGDRDGDGSPYAGLVIAPEEGLIPSGRDARSGLQEFGHLASGKMPRRGDDGRLEVDADTALVLVLIPGGAREPFFCAKYAMTRGQWLRLGGVLPEGDGLRLEDPVTSVSREECAEVLRRGGLKLATPEEWEIASESGSGAQRAGAIGVRAVKDVVWPAKDNDGGKEQ